MKNTGKKTVLTAVIFAVLLLVGSFSGVLAGYLLSGKTSDKEKAVVSDALCELVEEYGVTHCYHIPQVNSDAEGIDSVNAKIADTLYDIYHGGVVASREKYGFINLGSMVYTYTQKDNIVSIVVQTQDNRSEEYDYYVFNVDIKNGSMLTTGELCAAFGKDEKAFSTEVRAAVSKYSEREKTTYPDDEVEKYINPIITRTLSTEYINAAMPFINEDGELFAVVSLFSSGGKDTYRHMFNLKTATVIGAIELCTGHKSSNSGSSQQNTAPEVTYIYVQTEEKTTVAREEKTTVSEEITTAEETTKASEDNKKPSSGSPTLTKEVLMSHSWKSYAQIEWEYVFNNDGTVDIYSFTVETRNYHIDGNTLYIDNEAYEYISVDESDLWKSDSIFSNSVVNELKPGEKFFWKDDGICNWLIDTTGRLDNSVMSHAIYMEFEYEKYDTLDSDEYIYFEFATWDIDEDGTEEMIFHEGTCEQDREYHFYTVRNRELIHLGSVHAWHAGLSDSDKGLIKYAGMSGEGDYHRLTIENDKIVETKEGTYNFPPVPDFGYEIEFYPSMY